MTKIGTISVLAFAFFVFARGAHSEVCDYTPSRLIGSAATSVGTAIAGSGAVAGVGLQAAGYYTLVHSGSGLTMLASTAAGGSAAGTVGIMAGTGGAVGTAGAILMAPVTIIVGGITLIGVGAFEGACYFHVERISDPYEVREVIQSIASQDEAVSIVKTSEGDAMMLEILGQRKAYLLRKLYIADGQLKHRDWGLNTTLGPVLFSPENIEE